MHIEEGTGKRQRVRQYQTQKLPGFDVASCKIGSEGQRTKVLENYLEGYRFPPQISDRYPVDICQIYDNYLLQKFMHKDLAQDGDKRVLGSDGLPTEVFVDPLRVQYRNVVEVRCCVFLSLTF